MKTRHVDMGVGLGLCAFCALLLSQLRNIPREGVIFPSIVLWALMACSILLMGRAFFLHHGKAPFFGDVPARRWCLVSSGFLLMVLGALFFSFKISMFLGMSALLCLLSPQRGPRAMAINIFVAACFIIFFHVFFTQLMHIYFPEPLWE